MATKKNSKPDNSPSLLRALKKRWWVILIAVIVIFGISSFAYQKYLDRQNVAEMEQLLADFEQLKTDVEAETGEKFYIESSCNSVGKFSESYACIVNLKPTSGISDEQSNSSIIKNQSNFLIENGCILASEGFKLESATSDYYVCSGIHVRPTNESVANKIFN